MRLVKTLLLIVAVFIGKIHICAGEYVRASGQLCLTCENLRELSSSGDQLGSRHGDCHDCCTLKACDSESEATKADLSKPKVWPAVLPLPVVLAFPVPEIIRDDERAPAVDLYLPNGPPTRTPSRAPPFPFA